MNTEAAKFRGIFPALVTPYTRDGEVNEESARKLVARCLNRGVRGFYVCGSTGEGFMLSLKERKRMLEVVADENAGRGTIIAHVGCISTDESIDLAVHARETGVDAISSVPPFYYEFTADEIINHYLDVTAAADLPMILYNFPAQAGFKLTPLLVAGLRKQDSRIIGVKHTSMNLFDLEQMLRIDDDFVVLAGHDQVLLGALAMGARGAIGSTYNIMPELYVQMIADFENRDLAAAQRIQQRVNSFIRLMSPGTGIPQLKAALELMGIRCNGCRRPIAELTAADRTAVERAIKEMGVVLHG